VYEAVEKRDNDVDGAISMCMLTTLGPLGRRSAGAPPTKRTRRSCRRIHHQTSGFSAGSAGTNGLEEIAGLLLTYGISECEKTQARYQGRAAC
jgi:hypothetical protein